MVSRIHARAKKDSVWMIFWQLYFILSTSRRAMVQNYLAAWKQKYPEYSIALFVDNNNYMIVPFALPDVLANPTTTPTLAPGTDEHPDDCDLLIHLNMFYSIIKVEGSIIQMLLPKVKARVDIIQVSIPPFGSERSRRSP